MSGSGELAKLTIEAYRKNNFSDLKGEFKVLINPEKYSRSFEICYNNTQPQGKASGTPEYNHTKSDEVSFELVFDATGVVLHDNANQLVLANEGIVKPVEQFLDLVFEYDGSSHSPNFLRLIWGDFSFECRLSTLKFDYTLFRPDGIPLRATAAATFVEYTNKVQLAKEQNNQSPDLTHVLTVKAGDTLPLMCYAIYGSSAYYPQVAAANDLVDFRSLLIGQKLVFPPLSTEGTR